jgi:8-oxo-dGTP pyrophosphatase MutT (NUDIX family)
MYDSGAAQTGHGNTDVELDVFAFTERIRSLLAARARVRVEDPGLICAAVLIPLLHKAGTWHVLVTQRTENVGHHKGQMSFPGGACEPGDVDLEATALRETYEEIGVPPGAVEVLGALDDFQTISSFVVTPFVGVIPYPFPYRLSDEEVGAVLEVPLSFLRDPSNLRVEPRNHDGQEFEVFFWDYRLDSRTYTIWGATAGILKHLLDLIL